MSERKGWMLLEGGPWGEMRKPKKTEEKKVKDINDVLLKIKNHKVRFVKPTPKETQNFKEKWYQRSINQEGRVIKSYLHSWKKWWKRITTPY